MASNDNAMDFFCSPTSEYENWQHIVDIEDDPEDMKTVNSWNIYKVPSNLRKLNEEAYTPQLISIGPIHHGQENLNPMQDQKLLYLMHFWRRVENKIRGMDRFKKFLEDKEKDIRQCYAGNLCNVDKIKKEKLVEMMFLDSVFIMELFLRIGKQKYSDDIILKQSWLNNCIQRDLLLLENQIPLFILEELYKNFVPDTSPDKRRPLFIELAHDYFDRFHPYEKRPDKISSSHSNNPEPSTHDTNNSAGSCLDRISSSRFLLLKSNWPGNKYEPKHLTDVIRCSCNRACLHQPSNSIKWIRMPLINASKLRDSGVSFEVVKNRQLLDIRFLKVPILSWFSCFGCFPHSSYFKTRLQIPQLRVDRTTECALRNLIAFELCHCPIEPYICNYISFMDSLIHTKDDVELLVDKEVIVHELGGDNDVATLVSELRPHVATDKTCYKMLMKNLNIHSSSQWNRNMATLRLVYFRDGWRATSTLVATAVLVFTIFNFCRDVGLVPNLEGGYKKP